MAYLLLNWTSICMWSGNVWVCYLKKRVKHWAELGCCTVLDKRVFWQEKHMGCGPSYIDWFSAGFALFSDWLYNVRLWSWDLDLNLSLRGRYPKQQLWKSVSFAHMPLSLSHCSCTFIAGESRINRRPCFPGLHCLVLQWTFLRGGRLGLNSKFSVLCNVSKY